MGIGAGVRTAADNDAAINDSEETDDEESESGSEEEDSMCATLAEVRRVFEIPAEPDLFEQAKKEVQMAKSGDSEVQPDMPIEQLKSEFDYFVLLLDPGSRIYYRKIIGRDDFIRLEPLPGQDDLASYNASGAKSFASANSRDDIRALGDKEPQTEEELHQTIMQRQYEAHQRAEAEHFMNRNEETLVTLTKLLVLPGFSWTFVGEADSFRRRPFPVRFLQYERSDYPTYVHTSKLSQAFDKRRGIATEVDLSEYADVIKRQHPQSKNEPSSTFKYSQPESLVTSTKEFIRNIIRFVFQRYQRTRLRAKRENHILTLQVAGYREFLLGNYQLLHYERVRQCLRKGKPLRLVLTEIDLNFRDKYFPPLFKMKKTITYPILHVREHKFLKQQQKLDEWLERQKALGKQKDREKQEQENKKGARGKSTGADANKRAALPIGKRRQDLKEAAEKEAQIEEDPPGDYVVSREEAARVLSDHRYQPDMDLVRFGELQSSSPYFWYSPVPDLSQELKRLSSEKQHVNTTSFLPRDTPRAEVNHGLTRSDRIMQNWVNVRLDKKVVSVTRHRHLNRGTTPVKPGEQVVVESGECNYRFRFKIVSVERISQIFDEIRKPIATDNLETQPQNVTLNPSKVRHTREKKEEKKASVKEQRTTDTLATMATERSGSGIEEEVVDQKQESSKGNKEKERKSDKRAIANKSWTLNEHRLISERYANAKKDKETEPELLEAIKVYNKIQSTWTSKNFKGILARDKTADKETQAAFQVYKADNFEAIKTPLCNFADGIGTVECYKNILRFSIGNFTPLKIRIDCDLFHGCERLVETQVSAEVYFSNNIIVNRWVDFGNLRYCQLPMKTRLSVNIVMVFKEHGHELVIGCVSLNLFDEKKRFRQGMQDFSLWPFYEYDARLGCMKEYKGREYNPDVNQEDIIRTINSQFAKIVLQFEEFTLPMYYSSRDIKQIKNWKLMENEEDKQDLVDLLVQDNAKTNEDLSELKKSFEKNPLDKLTAAEKKMLFRTRKHYCTVPEGLPLFLRCVAWHKPLQVNETYKMLQRWAPMRPEEALSLLDAKFPDERVRTYAVNRVNQMTDDDLAMYMLQFTQALMYEEQHLSPLAEMLIERSLQNPYIVGLAFYWALKGNLYQKMSYERYYLLLETFLMLCGKFRNELVIQHRLNDALRDVQSNVIIGRDGHLEELERPWEVQLPEAKVKKKKKNDDAPQVASWLKPQDEDNDEEEKESEKKQDKQKVDKWAMLKVKQKEDLFAQKSNHLPILFNTPVEPKFIVRDFNIDKCTFFKSKKVPILLWLQNGYKGGGVHPVLFKNGDDLRQDILTLQLIQIMDKIWLEHNLDLNMTPYKVIGTHCMQGYLEFVQDAQTLAMMQYDGQLPFSRRKGNVFNTFRNDTVMQYMRKKAKDKLTKAREQRKAEATKFGMPLDESTLPKIDDEIEREVLVMRQRFAKSAAGYCVASYVLGLGDRHPDNIMVDDTGSFLHIDFGHFLGNKKYFKVPGTKGRMRYLREPDPFVLTPEVAYFINGGPFKTPWYRRLCSGGPRPSARLQRSLDIAKQVEMESSESTGGVQQTQSATSHLRTTSGADADDAYALTTEADDDGRALALEESHVHEGPGDPLQKAVETLRKNKHDNYTVTDAYVKSPLFMQFERDCCRAYNILRKPEVGNQLINLFLLMMSAGMPELSQESDIKYLVDQLNFKMTEQEAAQHFKSKITEAMDGYSATRRRIDNFSHNIKQIYM